MNHKRSLPQMIGLMLTTLLLVACGTPQPTPPHTPVPPTPTATSAPKELTWDYVALGDSIVAQRGRLSYAVHYAAHIEADLRVKVNLDNRGWGGMLSGGVLASLRGNQELRDAISEAEVVTLVIGTNDLARPLVRLYKHGDCGGDDNQDCLRDALESFRVNYDAILAELLALCSSKTIIRTMTCAYISLEEYGDGFAGDIRPFYGPLNDHIIQASSENNIPVALMHLAFNGPDGDEDPADKGYIAGDGLHASELGAAAIADVHRELGYEHTCP